MKITLFLCLQRTGVFTQPGIAIAVLRGSWMPQRELQMRNKLPAILAAAAICLIVFGAVRGEASTVLEKGTNLCLECVGIG